MENERTEPMVVELKNELFTLPQFVGPTEVRYKINAEFVNYNVRDECYREIMVNYLRMLPLLEKQVELDKADYILYMHSFARVDDMSATVVDDIKTIVRERKPGAEIIVVGKACNVKDILDEEIENITYYPEDFVDRLRERFEFDRCRYNVSGRWFAIDDEECWLAIWPVDGCQNKCKFCRRSYMDIPFKSIPIERIRELLDLFRQKEPEILQFISLRAENLSEYGLDIYGEPSLYKVLELFNEYPEIKKVNFHIGLAIGELTERDIEAICDLKAKIKFMHISLEAGSDRLLKLIGKKHTVVSAKRIIEKIRRAHPEVTLSITVMVGIPTETLEDIDALAELLVEVEADQVLINFCTLSPRAPLYTYPQLSKGLVNYHNERLISLMRHEEPKWRFHNSQYTMEIHHRSVYRGTKRTWVRIDEFNKKYSNEYPRHPRETTVLRHFQE